jgi:hypothetical protein
MVKGKPRDPHKEQQWQRWIRDWRTSGLTVRAFCQQRGLAQPSFYAWRRELERRQAAAAAFVAVRLVGDEPRVVPAAIELVLDGQRTVRVAPGFDAATLRQLLAILEDKPC